MKKYLLLLTASLSLTVAFGQTNVYHPFPDSAFWRVDKYYYQPYQYPCFAKYYFHYYTAGDTVINVDTYKKIYRSYVVFNPISCAPPMSPPGPPASGYVGALKDDSLANKVFFIFPTKSTDSLLYDYTLAVGDTLHGHIASTYSPQFNLVVQSIDSVVINGKYRRRWNFPKDNNNDSTYFIAGVGSSGGLIETLNSYAIDFTYRHLVCVKDSSTTIFSSTYISPMGCSMIVNGTTDINSVNTFSIFPNPFSTQTTLQTAQRLQNASLTIYNSVGQTVKHVDNLAGQTVILHRDNLPSGLYFVRLMQDGNTISADKFVITDK